MLKFLKDNKLPAVFGALIVLYLTVLTACGGWSPSKHIDVSVPPGIAAATGSSLVVSLHDAVNYTFPNWQHVVSTQTAIFAQEIEDKKALLDFFGFLANTGLEIAAPSLGAAIPGGGLITALLGVGMGTFFRKPGDRKLIEQLQAAKQEIERQKLELATQYESKLASEKIASYNKGKKDVEEITSKVIGSIGG